MPEPPTDLDHCPILCGRNRWIGRRPWRCKRASTWSQWFHVRFQSGHFSRSLISWIWLAGIMSILPRIKHGWDLCWGQPRSEFEIRWTVNFLYSLIGGSLLGGLVECPSWWGCSLHQKRGVGMLSLDVSIWDKICGASKTNKCKGLSQNDAAWFVDGHPRCRINMNHIYVMSPSEVSCFFGFLFEQSILLSSCMFLCFCILLILLDIQWHLIWWVWRFEQIRAPRQSMPLPDEDDGHVPIPHRIEDQEKWSRKIHQPSKY